MNPRTRANLIADWRGYDEPKPKPDRTQLAGAAATAFLKQLGLGEQMDEDELKRVWKEIVGDFLAVHSTPVRLKDGILVVQVMQSTVHYELDRMLKPKLLKKLKERFGAKRIREIRFRI